MGYELISKENTRANKETRYANFLDKRISIKDKERRSIDLLKMVISRSDKPTISCSFGIDSVICIYLCRKALVEMGRNPSDIDVVWNDTANEFKEVRLYAKNLTQLWNLRLTVTKPKKTLKHIIDSHGGITDDYFTARKGSRSGGRPLSEKCCQTLKHEPMNRAVKQNGWDLIVVGLRADESSQRLQAGLRDGEYFYSVKAWKSFIVRPILWWTEEDIWEYVEQESIPYNDLYTMNMLKEDVDEIENQTKLSRKHAHKLKKDGLDVFTPRTGCMMCPIPIKYGYLQWMRLNYPKVYDAMIYNLGYGKVLLSIIPADVREELEQLLGITITEENAHEYIKEVLEAKPCVFDRF